MARRFLLLLIVLPLSAASQTLILGTQAGPLYVRRWDHAFGLAAVIGAATENHEVTGRIGVTGENLFRVSQEATEYQDFATQALVMLRFGQPGWMDLWPFVGAGLGWEKRENERGETPDFLWPVLEMGVRRRVLQLFQVGAALETQEFERVQLAIRLNLALGPFPRP